jgi:hypothetical protein
VVVVVVVLVVDVVVVAGSVMPSVVLGAAVGAAGVIDDVGCGMGAVDDGAVSAPEQEVTNTRAKRRARFTSTRVRVGRATRSTMVFEDVTIGWILRRR